MAGPNGSATAGLDDARLEQAPAPMRVRPVREALRCAAIHLDQTRGTTRRAGSSDAAPRWRKREAPRWSVLDHFASGGRRYLVTVQDEPRPEGPASLSLREWQVLALATLGHSNKEIAYELGIAHSTVKVLFARAGSKMGVRSREAILQSLEGLRRPRERSRSA